MKYSRTWHFFSKSISGIEKIRVIEIFFFCIRSWFGRKWIKNMRQFSRFLIWFGPIQNAGILMQNFFFHVMCILLWLKKGFHGEL